MTFTLLPAVDVADGRAVRTPHSEAETDLVAPLDVALAWQADGAEWIHLVDLDAAFGRGSNSELLAPVIKALDVKVELAGGIRDDATLRRALSTGCARVNIATTALQDMAWCARIIAQHGERIAVSLDVRVVEEPSGALQHRLAARGSDFEGGDLWESIAQLDRDGCARYVVTDVSRDGASAAPLPTSTQRSPAPLRPP